MTHTITAAEDLLAGVPASVDVDAALVAVADRERRQLLAILGAQEGAMGLSPLANALALERDDGADVERTLIRLYHVHVPKLETIDIVEFDEGERTVALTDHGRRLAALSR